MKSRRVIVAFDIQVCDNEGIHDAYDVVREWLASSGLPLGCTGVVPFDMVAIPNVCGQYPATCRTE
jgi:hypothetical protein